MFCQVLICGFTICCESYWCSLCFVKYWFVVLLFVVNLIGVAYVLSSIEFVVNLITSSGTYFLLSLFIMEYPVSLRFSLEQGILGSHTTSCILPIITFENWNNSMKIKLTLKSFYTFILYLKYLLIGNKKSWKILYIETCLTLERHFVVE